MTFPRLIVMVLLILAASAPAHRSPAQDGHNPAPPPPPPPAPALTPAQPRTPGAGRTELALAYLRFERILDAFPPRDDAEAERINRAFDAATLAFFAGGLAQTVEQVDELTLSLFPTDPSDPAAPAARRAVFTTRVKTTPRVCTLGPAGGAPPRRVTARIWSDAPIKTDLRDTDPAKPLLWLGLRSVQLGEPVQDRLVTDTTGTPIDLATPMDLGAGGADAPDAAGGAAGGTGVGTYHVVLRDDADAAGAVVGLLSIAAAPLDAARVANALLLTQAAAAHPELARTIAVCRDRNALLSDNPPESDATASLALLPELSASVSAELAAIARGENPYLDHPGDLWRTVPINGADLAARVYAPLRPRTEDSPRPLVIALHGAGGDENMFMDGYGLGVIKRLADRKGFIVAAPRVGPLIATPSVLDGLIDGLAEDYAIDRARVYVVGHSMGAGVAAAWGKGRPGSLAGVCCIAGFGGFKPGMNLPPTLVIAGELDPLMPAARIRPGVEAAAGDPSSPPLEFRAVPHYGHTLIVGHELPAAIDWLLAKRLPDR